VEQGTADNDTSSTWGAGGPALRLGMRMVRGMSEEKIYGVVDERRDGPIRSIRQLARRSDVSRETLLRLAAADAFRSLGVNRREALWHILALDRDEVIATHVDTSSLLAELEPREAPAALPAMTLDETVVQDYDMIGLSLNAHPIGLVREEFPTALGVVCNERLKHVRNGQRVAVAGLVLVRQRPSTANGIVFMTLEDETGVANLVVRPNIWDRDRTAARGKAALVADGVIQKEGEVIHVMVRRLYDLSELLTNLRTRSRDIIKKVGNRSRDFR
jgi:DNA polymerase III alpha subunit